MIDLLKRPRTIILSLVATMALAAAFQAWIPSVGGEILDRLSTLDETSALLASMTADQKDSHFWMTLVLDYAFPVAYSAFFAGLALQFGGRLGLMLALPAALVLPLDIIENTIQLFALKGSDGLLYLKAFLTPAKFQLFYLATIIALISLIWQAVRWINARRGANRAS